MVKRLLEQGTSTPITADFARLFPALKPVYWNALMLLSQAPRSHIVDILKIQSHIVSAGRKSRKAGCPGFPVMRIWPTSRSALSVSSPAPQDIARTTATLIFAFYRRNSQCCGRSDSRKPLHLCRSQASVQLLCDFLGNSEKPFPERKRTAEKPAAPLFMRIPAWSTNAKETQRKLTQCNYESPALPLSYPGEEGRR